MRWARWLVWIGIGVWCLVCTAAIDIQRTGSVVDCTNTGAGWIFPFGQSYNPCYCISRDAANRLVVVYIDASKRLMMQTFTGTFPDLLILTSGWATSQVLWAPGSATTLRALDCWDGTVALAYNNSLRLQNIYYGFTTTEDESRVVYMFNTDPSFQPQWTSVHVCRECVYPRVYLVEGVSETIYVVAMPGQEPCELERYVSTFFRCIPPTQTWNPSGSSSTVCCGNRFTAWDRNTVPGFVYSVFPVDTACSAAAAGSSTTRMPYSSSLSPDGAYLALAYSRVVSGVGVDFRLCVGQFTRPNPSAGDTYQGSFGTWTWSVAADSVQSITHSIGNGFAYAYTQLSRNAVWLVVKETAQSRFVDKFPEARVYCFAAPLRTNVTLDTYTVNLSATYARGVNFYSSPFDADVLFAAPSGCWPDHEGLRVLFAASNVYTPTWVDIPLDLTTHVLPSTSVFPPKDIGWVTSGGSRNTPNGTTVIGSLLGSGPNNNVVTAATQSPQSRNVWLVNMAKAATKGLGYIVLDDIVTPSPTSYPTRNPTPVPTALPTALPTRAPTTPPTAAPTATPTTPPPTAVPTATPTTPPPTTTPTTAPPTAAPIAAPTTAPPTAAPIAAPTTAPPTAAPIAAPTPTPPTAAPTALPTVAAGQPSPEPTIAPTALPSTEPSPVPSSDPTTAPSPVPSAPPTAGPTALPTARPTALPTAAPTLAPATQVPVPCINSTSYGVGTRFVNETRTCDDSGSTNCTLSLNFTCASGTVDWGTVRCGAYVRRCTSFEFTQRCPNSSATATGAAAACQWLCPLDFSSPCVAYGNTTCGAGPVDAPAVALPTAQCSYYCGPGVRRCDGVAPPVSACVCASDLIDALGVTSYTCPGQALTTTDCSVVETLTYCGSEFTRTCRKRAYMLSDTAATSVTAYLDFSSASSPAATDVLGFFAPEATARPPQPLSAFAGVFATWIPECLCTNQVNDTAVGTWINDAAYWRSVLPYRLDAYTQRSPVANFTGGVYDGTLRRYFTACAASHLPAVDVWGRTGGSAPATAAGWCNGAGRVDPSVATSCSAWQDARYGRSALQLRQAVYFENALDNSFFPPILVPVYAQFAYDDWLYASHVLLDVYARKVVTYGCSAATTQAAAWQAANTGAEALRYVVVRATPSDCERDYLTRYCGGAYDPGPLFVTAQLERCRDPRAKVNISYASGGVRVRHPVLQCLDQHSLTTLCTGVGCIDVAPGATRPHLPSTSSCTANAGLCVCPPALTGANCTTRQCASNATCAPAFVGTTCVTDGATCILPLGHTGRAGCVNGWFDWFNNTCQCERGWTRNATTGACTAPECSDAALRALCTLAGGVCVAPNTCTACPFGRWGVDCTGVRNATTGYWGGFNGSVPYFYRTCVNGHSGTDVVGEIVCVCDEGWSGEDCSVSLCPVVNGQVCAGQGQCQRIGAATYGCRATATLGTCNREGCSWSTAQPRVLNTSVDGCACQLRTEDYCIKPGSSSICSNVLDNSSCPVCRARPRTGTNGLVEELYCDCASGTSQFGTTGRYCDRSLCSAPGSTSICSNKGSCSANGRCTCFNQSSSAGGLGVGEFCEESASPCTYQKTSVLFYICNDPTGGNPCVKTNGTWACQCATNTTSASKCRDPPTLPPTATPTRTPTILPTTSPPTAVPTPKPTVAVGQPTPQPTVRPTPQPTSVPATARPTAVPTAAPTPNASTVLNPAACDGYCTFGVCMYNPQNASNPTCGCPYPNVYAYDSDTRDCLASACVNNTRPASNRTACVCSDPSWVQISPTTCRAPLTCASANGTVCGPVHPLDTRAADARCADGTCVCTGLYRNASALANTTCTHRCSTLNTASLAANGTCVCAAEWRGDATCTTSTCNSSTVFLNGACVALAPTPNPTPRPTHAPSSAPSAVPTPQPTQNPNATDEAAPAENLSDGSLSSWALSNGVIIAISVGGFVVVGGTVAFLVYWFVYAHPIAPSLPVGRAADPL